MNPKLNSQVLREEGFNNKIDIYAFGIALWEMLTCKACVTKLNSLLVTKLNANEFSLVGSCVIIHYLTPLVRLRPQRNGVE